MQSLNWSKELHKVAKRLKSEGFENAVNSAKLSNTEVNGVRQAMQKNHTQDVGVLNTWF